MKWLILLLVTNLNLAAETAHTNIFPYFQCEITGGGDPGRKTIVVRGDEVIEQIVEVGNYQLRFVAYEYQLEVWVTQLKTEKPIHALMMGADRIPFKEGVRYWSNFILPAGLLPDISESILVQCHGKDEKPHS